MLSEILVTSVIVSAVFYYLTRKASLGKSLPGPWGLPLVGHLPFLGKNPPLTLLKWKRTYGPIFAVQFGSFPAVVLNDGKLVKEAFNLEAVSGRPRLTNFVEMGGHKGIVFTDGPRQVEQRKFSIKALREIGLGNSKMESCIQEQITKFLQNLKIKCKTTPTQSNAPIEISHFFRRPIVNAIWVAFMGKTFEEGDPMLDEVFTIFDRCNATSETIVAQLSWFFPLVSKFLTSVGINRTVQDIHYLYAYIKDHIQRCRTDNVAGKPKHFTQMYFDQVAQTKDPSSSFHSSRNEQAVTTGDIFMGAVDTTTTSMDWLLIHLAREPEVQKKFQSEIDSVLGGAGDNSRIPSLSDRTSMPYTEGVIQELFRISPPLPLGLFRRTLEDIQLQGYNIPKNTMVFPNIYGIHRDPEIWSEPNKFMPERFLDEEGRRKKVSGDILSFSSGKRSCIGEAFGRDEIFLIATSFFQKFTVSLPKEKDKFEAVQEKFGMILLPPDNYELVVRER